MKKNIIAILILTITALECYSQESLRPGYIITLENDSLSGSIDFRNSQINSTKCIFYRDNFNEAITYLPGEITAYRFNDDKYYVSKKVKIGSDEKVVFLEYLVKGITSLYYLKDKDADHYFIEKGADMYELTNNVSIIKDGNGQYFRESNIYKGMLTIIYSGSKEIVPLINSAKFDRKSMMKLSEEYHNLVCTEGECIVYEKTSKIFKLKVGPVIGYQWNSPEYRRYLSKFKFTGTQTFQVGFAGNLKFLSFNEKLSLGIKALYGKDYFTASYSTHSGNSTDNTFISFKKNKLSTSLHLIYEYPRGKLRPIAGIGTGLSFYYNNDTDLTQTVVDNNGGIISRITKENVIKHFHERSFSAITGFNFSINNKNTILFNFYYNRGLEFYREKGISIENVYRDIRTSSFGIITGFLF